VQACFIWLGRRGARGRLREDFWDHRLTWRQLVNTLRRVLAFKESECQNG